MLRDAIAGILGRESPESEIRDVDLIVPISYTTKKDELVNATKENLLLAIYYKTKFPDAVLAMSNCSYTFHGAEKCEQKLKGRILFHERIGEYISAKAMNNSITEARAVKEALNFTPKRILVVTGQMHARSARLIWSKIFPESTILIRTTNYRNEYQKDHPVVMQRTFLRWLYANIAREILIRTIGMDLTSKMQHRSKHPDL